MANVSDSFVSTQELKRCVDRLAGELDRSRSWIIREALLVGLPVVGQYRQPAQTNGDGHDLSNVPATP